MNIVCSNFKIPPYYNELKLDQVLMGVSADCRLVKHSSSFDLPELAILWFLENLIRSCQEIANNQSVEEAFRDFYGEYEVAVRPSGNSSMKFSIETGCDFFTAKIDFCALHDDVISILCCVESKFKELSDSLVFNELKDFLIEISFKLKAMSLTSSLPSTSIND